MKIKINREQPFQVLATNFSIGPSSSGYDLQISADGVNYTTLFSVGANVTRMVTGVANGSYYKLAGNTDEDVIVNWFRQCDDGQGGGGAGSQGPQGTAGAQGYQGPANSGYKISLSTHSYENYTQEDIAAINTFLAAVSADSATLNGAYVVVGGQDVFYLSRYEEGYALFGDANNGYIHSISWDFDPETAEITGGEYVVNSIEGGNEPAFGLKAVEELGTNWDYPEAGDVQAHFSAYTETQEVSGTYDDGLDTGGMLPTHIICNEDIDGTIFAYDGSTWEIGWDGTGITLTLVDGEDNITGVYTISEKGDASDDGYDFSLLDGDDGVRFNIFIEKNFEINNYYSIDGTDTAFADYFAVPEGITGEYTGYTEETKAIADGVWQYSPVSGAIAEWSNIPERNGNDVRSFALSFDYIPDGTELFRVKYFNATYYTKLVYSGNALYTFTEEDGYTVGTYLCSMNDSGATLAVSQGSSTHPKLLISKHNIAFYQHQSSGFGLFFWEGFWNCIATGAHWFRVDRPAPKLYLGGTHSGLLAANDAGQIIGWPTDQPTKRTNKINNGYVNVYAGNSVPNIWAPTDGGTAGQMLISNGTSAPTWTNWIKSVQITADAYEALQIKDPNTLYLIVNE